MQVILLVIMPAFLLYACSSPTVNGQDSDSIELNVNKQLSVTNVQTAASALKPFVYPIECNGKIISLHDQVWKMQTGGVLKAFTGINGKYFRQGELLARLDTTLIRFRLEKALLQRYNAGKEYQSQLLGYESLLQNKQPAEIEAIKEKLRISTGLAIAEQDIREVEYDLSQSVIYAPFSGMLADVKIQQGQQLTGGQEMFRLYDPANLLLEVSVLEADIALLKKGMPALVTPVANTALKYEAAVQEINPYVDNNGMVTVKLRIAESRPASLFPGMNCNAVIQVAMTSAVIVPKDAIVMHDGKAVVFTLEDEKAKWNYVQTGRENGNEIEIRSGLQTGLKVIVTNNLQLAHDAPVKEVIPGYTQTTGH